MLHSCHTFCENISSNLELRGRYDFQYPVILIAGRPKAALLLWFFGDFRCGALLFVVIHVIYKYKNR